MTSTAFIGLGSNLGDRELNLLRAVAEVGRISGVRITGLSSFYETEPVGPEQDDFLNAVARVETTLTPQELLVGLQKIEDAVFNRKRVQPWGPRTMDLDILLFGDLVVEEENLVIPHPRLHERHFVLVPLVEIAPEAEHPVLRTTAAKLLASLPAGPRVVKV